MTPFDATTKQLVESRPQDWIRLLKLPGDAVEIIGADLATISTQADRVVRVLSPVPYLLHIEFQAGHDGSEVPERLLRYNVLLRYRHRLPVQSVVILLRPGADSPALNGVITQYAPDGDINLEFRYRTFRIWEQQTSALLAGGLATLPLTLLTVSEADMATTIRAMEKRVAQEATPDEARTLFAATYILLGLRFRRRLSTYL